MSPLPAACLHTLLHFHELVGAEDYFAVVNAKLDLNCSLGKRAIPARSGERVHRARLPQLRGGDYRHKVSVLVNIRTKSTSLVEGMV